MPDATLSPKDSSNSPGQPGAELSALLTATAAGDRRAFRELYDATSRRLFGIALMILRRREAAEDVLQEAFVRVWVEARRYDPARGPALPWLSRIVRNLAIDHLRRDRGAHDDIADQAETLAAPGAPVSERMDLQRGLSQLAADQRDVIALAFVHGYTHEELAERLNVPLGTAKSRVRRGLKQMLAFFEAEPAASAC